MTLPNIRQKIKEQLAKDDISRDVFLVLTVFFVCNGAFLAWRISEVNGQGRSSLKILNTASASGYISHNEGNLKNLLSNKQSSISSSNKGVYVASKNGKAFYLPSCSGAKRILESNQIWFNSKSDALASGYQPALNCKGL